MKLQNFTHELRTLIAEGKPEDALAKLLELYRRIRGKYHDEVIVISSRFNDIQEEQMAGIIDPDDAQRKYNQVNHSLLQVIENLDKDPAVARYFGAKPTPTSEGGMGKKIILWGVSGIFVVMLGFFFFTKFSNSEPPSEKRVEQPAGDETTDEKSVTENPPPAKKEQKGDAVNGMEKEPNNSLFEPNEIRYNSTTSGYITDREDKDCFTFTTSDSYRNVYNIRIENKSQELSPALTIFNAKRKKIKDLYESTKGADLSYVLRTPPNATCHLTVESFGTWEGSGNYNLIVEKEDFDAAVPTETEPNETTSEASLLGKDNRMAGFAWDNRDKDYFRFTASQSGKAIAKISNRSEHLSPSISWFNSTKKKLKSTYESTKGADLELAQNVESGETYFVLFEHFGTWKGYGDYVLEITFE